MVIIQLLVGDDDRSSCVDEIRMIRIQLNAAITASRLTYRIIRTKAADIQLGAVFAIHLDVADI